MWSITAGKLHRHHTWCEGRQITTRNAVPPELWAMARLLAGDPDLTAALDQYRLGTGDVVTALRDIAAAALTGDPPPPPRRITPIPAIVVSGQLHRRLRCAT
jgi:hypothetical protein